MLVEVLSIRCHPIECVKRDRLLEGIVDIRAKNLPLQIPGHLIEPGSVQGLKYFLTFRGRLIHHTKLTPYFILCETAESPRGMTIAAWILANLMCRSPSHFAWA